MNEIKTIEGGVNAPKGFWCSGMRAGIKPGKTNKDLALVFSDHECRLAGVFTKNVVKAAPVYYDLYAIEHHQPARGVIINTGYANACTGEKGISNVYAETEHVADQMDVKPEHVLVMSTGVIGQQVPIETILNAIPQLCDALSQETKAAHDAAEAIMTTDTRPKKLALEFEVAGKIVRMGGMCKGSGMIHPNMGTMLCTITTDLAIDQDLLQKALSEIVEETFNMISVDGDTSTNDTVLVLANGQAGNVEVTVEDEDYQVFYKALTKMMTYLAKCIAADGEGATRLLEATVTGAATKEDAKIMAKSIICSNLTKAAVFGKDANWGRILCAMGYSGVTFDPNLVSVRLTSDMGQVVLVEQGVATDYDEELATRILSADSVTILADVKQGEAMATAWGCDLTYDYVKINADYRS